jgi:hypothetical protein
MHRIPPIPSIFRSVAPATLAKGLVVALIEGELESAVAVGNSSVMGRMTPRVGDTINLSA